jgi:hypothetical protein
MPEIKSSGQNFVNLLMYKYIYLYLFIVYFMKLSEPQLTLLQMLE